MVCIMTNSYIIYHQVKPGIDCPDGIAAAWVATRSPRYRQAQPIGASYGQPIALNPQPGDDILCVDFTPPHQTLTDWRNAGTHTIKVIDHHKTAWEQWQSGGLHNIADAIFDVDNFECGATLTWKVLFWDNGNSDKYPVPAFLEYVRKRDLWLDCDLFADPIPETLVIHEAMAADRLDRQGNWVKLRAYYDALASCDRDGLFNLLGDRGRALVESKRETVKAIAGRHDWYPFLMPDGTETLIPFVALNATEDRHLSDVGNYLVRNLDPPFVLIESSDGRWGLRSHNDGEDVGAIAKYYGGGGHRNASGFDPRSSEKLAENSAYWLKTEFEAILSVFSEKAKGA